MQAGLENEKCVLLIQRTWKQSAPSRQKKANNFEKNHLLKVGNSEQVPKSLDPDKSNVAVAR
jgi:hypothetical protein